MASEIDIANFALSLIGETPIESLDEHSTKSDLLIQIMPFALEGYLSDGDWSFATKRVALAQDANAPLSGYSYQYSLPVDFNHLIEVNGSPTSDYRIENGYLLSDEASIIIKYVSNDIEYSAIKGKAILAYSTYIGSLMIYPLYGDSRDASTIEQKYQIALSKALMFDAKTRLATDDSGETWGSIEWQNM